MRWKNTLFVIDFDKTVTLKDTIGLLGQFGLDHSNVSKPWSHFTQAYLKDYDNHSPPAHHDLESLFSNLNSFKKIELVSIKRINQEKVFQGLTRDMLFKKGKEYSEDLLQPKVISVLQRIPKEKIRIVSVNWSKDWILGFLYKLDLSRQQIISNDIELGEIQPLLVTTGDKQKIVKEMGQIVYVGDSVGDLGPLLYADIGIVIGNDQQILKIIEKYSLNLVHVNDWSEINKILFD